MFCLISSILVDFPWKTLPKSKMAAQEKLEVCKQFVLFITVTSSLISFLERSYIGKVDFKITVVFSLLILKQEVDRF